MNRRQLLSLSLFIGLMGAVPSNGAQPSIRVRDWLRQWAIRRDRSGHAFVGQRAISLGLVEPNSDIILLQLENRIGKRLAPSTSEARSRLLSNLIAQDFADECTVQIDGWILSRCEIELCALAALTRTRHIGGSLPNALR